MSVVAAAVGPAAGAAAYGGGVGPQLCGSGARKRKDVVQDQEAEVVESRRGDHVAERHHRHGLFVLERVDKEGEEEEKERSSIGAASAGEEEEEDGEEADSGPAAGVATRRRTAKQQQGALACLDALDDALPIKRGLSNFFSGKSRSFANLQDAAVTSSARDLAKPENPFNKRRRVLRCCSIRRVASTSLTALPPFLPPPNAGTNNGPTSDGGGGSGG